MKVEHRIDDQSQEREGMEEVFSPKTKVFDKEGLSVEIKGGTPEGYKKRADKKNVGEAGTDKLLEAVEQKLEDGEGVEEQEGGEEAIAGLPAFLMKNQEEEEKQKLEDADDGDDFNEIKRHATRPPGSSPR
jgi:hypothetical protein